MYYGWLLPGAKEVIYLVPHTSWYPTHLFRQTTPEARYITSVAISSDHFTEKNFQWDLDRETGTYTGSIEDCGTKRVEPEDWNICSKCLKSTNGPQDEDGEDPDGYCMCWVPEWEEKTRQEEAERQRLREEWPDDEIPF